MSEVFLPFLYDLSTEIFSISPTFFYLSTSLKDISAVTLFFLLSGLKFSNQGSYSSVKI